MPSIIFYRCPPIKRLTSIIVAYMPPEKPRAKLQLIANHFFRDATDGSLSDSVNEYHERVEALGPNATFFQKVQAAATTYFDHVKVNTIALAGRRKR